MQPEGIRYAISTDKLGFFGQSTSNLSRMVPKTMEQVKLVEVVGVRPLGRLRSFVDDLKQKGYEIAQIHGPTGKDGSETFVDKMKLRIISWLSPTTKELLEHFPDCEILIHGAEVSDRAVQQAIVDAKPKFVWIENHIGGAQKLDEAIQISKQLHEQGVNTAVMLDISHIITDYQEVPLAQKWERMLQTLQRLALEDANIGGVHLCIGTSHDKLMLEELSDADLRSLAGVLRMFPIRTVVLENQQGGMGGLLGTALLGTDHMKNRTAGIYRRLTHAGLIS